MSYHLLVTCDIRNEVGESDEARDKMLIQIDQECLDVYKRNLLMAL